MKITEELVDYVSTLSRLRLPDGEKARMAEELERIVSYMDVLEQIDTQGVEPLSHVFPICNVTRPDVVRPSQAREELLANSPVPGESAFLVPKAVE